MTMLHCSVIWSQGKPHSGSLRHRPGKEREAGIEVHAWVTLERLKDIHRGLEVSETCFDPFAAKRIPPPLVLATEMTRMR